MPEEPVSPTTFPEFPTQFTEEEAKRLKELETQKAEMERIYQTKFTPSSWTKASAPAKFIRGVIQPTFLANVARLVTPASWGYDYGMTPEEAQSRLLEVQKEQVELAREQRVSNLSPLIQDALRALALSGEGVISSREELNQYFKLGELGFTDEEIAWVVSYAQSLLGATTEEVISGEKWQQETYAPDWAERFFRRAALTPEQLAASVSFTQDVEEITSALRATSVTGGELATRQRAALDEYVTELEATGVKVTVDKSLKDAGGEAFQRILDQEGEIIALSSEETGDILIAAKMKDNSIRFEGETIAHYDPEKDQIRLCGVDGQLLPSDSEMRGGFIGLFQKLYNGLHLGAKQAWDSVRETFTTTIPYFIATKVGTPIGEYVPVPTAEQWNDPKALEELFPSELLRRYQNRVTLWGQQEAISWVMKEITYNNAKLEGMGALAQARYEESQVRFQGWLEKNPGVIKLLSVYQTANPLKTPGLFLDPGYYAYTIGSVAPTMTTALVVMIGGTVLTGNPLVGAAAGMLVMTPLEQSQVYHNMLDNGASPEVAAQSALTIGTVIGAVEIVPGLIYLKAVSPVFMQIFRKNLNAELTKQVAKQLGVKGLLKTGSKITISETTEEVLQETMHNAAIRTVNENHSLVENLSATAINSFIGFLPFTAFGMGSQYYATKAYLSKITQQKIDEMATKLVVEGGLTPQHAESVAITNLMETEEGRTEVKVAQEKADAEIPSTTINWDEVSFHKKITPEYQETLKAATEALMPLVGKGFNLKEIKIDGRLKSTNAEITPALGRITFRSVDTIELGTIYHELAHAYSYEDISTGNFSFIESYAKAAGIEFDKEKVISFAAGTEFAEISRYLAKVEKLSTEEVLEGERRGYFSAYNHLYGETATKDRLEGRFAKDFSTYFTNPDYLEKAKPAVWEFFSKTFPKSVDKRRVFTGKIARLIDKLSSLRDELIGYTDSLAYQESELEKARSRGGLVDTSLIEGNIQSLKERINETEIEKARIVKDIQNIREELKVKPVEEPEAPVEEPVPEGFTGKDREEQIRLQKIGSLLATTLDQFLDLKTFPGEQMPGLLPFDEEIAAIEKVLEENPDFVKYLGRDEGVTKAEVEAKYTLDIYQSVLADLKKRKRQKGLSEAESESLEEETALAEESFADLARKSGMGKALLMTTGWKALTPMERKQLTVASLPEGSSKAFRKLDWVRDTRLIFANWETKTGLPFLTLFERMLIARSIALRNQDRYLNRIKNNPELRPLLRDKQALTRVSLELNARDPYSKVPHPEGLTVAEGHLADIIAATYKDWEPIVRYLRFTEAYKEGSDLGGILGRIFANKEQRETYRDEVEQSIKIYEEQGKQVLWEYLKDKVWGVYGSGYDPRRAYIRNLSITEPGFNATRGARFLMSRESLEMPAGQELENPVKSMDNYNLSMGIRYFLGEEIDKLADLMKFAQDKWVDQNEAYFFAKSFLRELQGYGMQRHLLTETFGRLMRWSRPVIFWHPFQGVRNLAQVLYAAPDKIDLLRMPWKYRQLPPSLRQEALFRFRAVVDQSGRPMRDWMFQSDYTNLWNPLNLSAFLCSKIPTLAFTDRTTRAAQFGTSLIKAWEATEQYKKDGDLDKWIRKSGISYLPVGLRGYILCLLKRPTISWGIRSLRDVPGADAACIKIAEEVTNQTLYLYDRALAGRLHWDVAGRTLGSLLIFPRSTVQMVGIQFDKLISKESTTGERVTATKNLVLLWLSGELVGSFLMFITGRRRNEYQLASMLQWELGGLTVGVATDVSQFVGDLFLRAWFGNEEDMKRARDRLPTEADQFLDIFIGGYRVAMDAVEAAKDEPPGYFTRRMRVIRSWIDENYTPQEQEEIERTFIEKMQKVFMGTRTPEPTVLEQALTDLRDAHENLGVGQADGSIYTLKQFGGEVSRVTKDLPPFWVSEEMGFSELAIFYKECEDAWGVYDTLPSSPTSIRTEWRQSHIEEEAMMIFWGKVAMSVFGAGSPEEREVTSLLNIWFDLHDILPNMHPALASWESLTPQ